MSLDPNTTTHMKSQNILTTFGTLLVSAVHAGDYSLVLGIATVSILAVSIAVLSIDLLYPLLDPRVKAR